MEEESDEAFYARRARQELDLSAATSDPAIKKIHLDLPARYATKRERAARGEAIARDPADDRSTP